MPKFKLQLHSGSPEVGRKFVYADDLARWLETRAHNLRISAASRSPRDEIIRELIGLRAYEAEHLAKVIRDVIGGEKPSAERDPEDRAT